MNKNKFISEFMVFKGESNILNISWHLGEECWCKDNNEDGWDLKKLTNKTQIVGNSFSEEFRFRDTFREAISTGIRLIPLLRDSDERINIYKFYKSDEKTGNINTYVLGEVKIFRDGTCVWKRDDYGGIKVYNRSDDWSITTNWGPPKREPKYCLAMLDKLYNYPEDLIHDNDKKYKRPYDQYCTERNDKDVYWDKSPLWESIVNYRWYGHPTRGPAKILGRRCFPIYRYRKPDLRKILDLVEGNLNITDEIELNLNYIDGMGNRDD